MEELTHSGGPKGTKGRVVTPDPQNSSPFDPFNILSGVNERKRVWDFTDDRFNPFVQKIYKTGKKINKYCILVIDICN